jgi:lactate permease
MPQENGIEASPLPIDLLHWSLALIPIVMLLILLVGRRWSAPEAGPIGVFAAALVAIFAFQTPLDTLAVAGGKGVWDAIFILFVVWPALLLYRVTERAGAFVALRHGIERFSDNQLFLVLGFGWVFASFLQGIAGFGTPIAVVAPLLIAIGVRPLYAVVIPLIGHAWANMFGTLAVGWLATLQVVTLESETATAFQSALLLWIPNIVAGFTIAWLFGRWAAVRHAVPLVLIITVIHGGGQLLLTLWDPVLSNFLASSLGLLALYPLSRWGLYRSDTDSITDRPAMREGASREEREEDAPEPVMSLGMAGMPYIVLTLATIIALVPAPIEQRLEQFEVGLAFPAVQTGYGHVVMPENGEEDEEDVAAQEDPDVMPADGIMDEEEAEVYSPFAPFTHPGTFLLLSALVAALVYRQRGYYGKWEEKADETQGIWSGLVEDAVPASVAVIAFLVMSKMMDHSGQIEVLALGIAGVAPPVVFAFMSNWIGVLGAFMTSSNTASNILFAPLQQETVTALGGLSESTIIGAQSAGGAIGNAIAPANVVLGTGTAGIVGREGDVLRKTLPWALAVAVLTGGATILINMFTA